MTAYGCRISDWSSSVCSAYLEPSATVEATDVDLLRHVAEHEIVVGAPGLGGVAGHCKIAAFAQHRCRHGDRDQVDGAAVAEAASIERAATAIAHAQVHRRRDAAADVDDEGLRGGCHAEQRQAPCKHASVTKFHPVSARTAGCGQDRKSNRLNPSHSCAYR